MDVAEYIAEFEERDWQESDPGAGPVRVAMVGLGWWVREKSIPAVRESDLCETTALVSRSKEKAADLAADVETVEAPLSAEEFHDGVATDAYDAVYVSTPNATHLPYVESAVAHDKAVLCEKPMEADADRAARMVEAADGAGVTLMVAYRMHTEPAVRRLRGLVEEGFVGDPVFVHGHMSQRLLDIIPDPDQWRLDPALAGPGTTVTDIGIYPLNTTRFVLGADPVATQASMASVEDAFADVPDERAAFTAEFPDGVRATCTASQNAAFSDHLEVIGTEGTARVDPAFAPELPRTITVTQGGAPEAFEVEGVDQMREEFDYFADCLLAGRRPVADGEHGLVDMRAIEAVYDAAERGERVEV